MTKINTKKLVESLHEVEKTYKSVNFAPDQAMEKVWYYAKASRDSDSKKNCVKQHTYDVIAWGIGHGVPTMELARMLNFSRSHTSDIVRAYRHNVLKVRDRSEHDD